MIEIHDNDLLADAPPLADSFYQWNTSSNPYILHHPKDYSVLTHKIVSNPIVQAIYKIKFDMDKPLYGLSEEVSTNDGGFFTDEMRDELRPTAQDSWPDEDDDLEDMMVEYTRHAQNSQENEQGRSTDEYDPILKDPKLGEVLVTIQNSSIKIGDNSTFELKNCTIRSSNILRGQKIRENVLDEDALLLTTSSGYLLLIKLYLVEGYKVKPYVVQWWRTGVSAARMLKPKSLDVGRDVITHTSGRAAILTSISGLLRIHYFTQTKHGVMIDRIQNLPFDGTVIHTCLVEPDGRAESHSFFFSMVVTSQKRLIIRLFEWSLDECKITEHTPFLLTADFEIPVFIIPLKDSVLLVKENSISLAKVHQLLSADSSFLEVFVDWTFPVSYFKADAALFTTGTNPEVYISTEEGTIFSVTIQDNMIYCNPLLKIPKMIHFLIEKTGIEDTYDVFYSTEIGKGGYRRFENLKLGSPIPKPPPATTKWDNWAPLFDIEIAKKANTEELWLAHGKWLSQLKIGITCQKLLSDPNLSSAKDLFSHHSSGRLFFILSFVDKTLVFKYENEDLISIHDSGLSMDIRTVYSYSLGDICTQVTERSIVITNFENGVEALTRWFEEEIIFADCFESVTAIVTESPFNQGTLVLSLFQSRAEAIIKIGEDLQIPQQPNFLKFLVLGTNLYIVLGTVRSLVLYRVGKDGVEALRAIDIDIDDPHDMVASGNILYISSRYGQIITFDISEASNCPRITFRKKLSVCSGPIDLYFTGDYMILISSHIWKWNLKENYPIPIVVKEQVHRKIHAVAVLTDENIALLREDGFNLASLSSSATEPVLRTISLDQLAKKLKYLCYLKLFVLLSETGIMFADTRRQLDVKMTRGLTSLFESETPLCIGEWIIPSDRKSFRSLLIGCNTASGGSLKILGVKFSDESKEVLTIKQRFRLKTSGAVLSVQQLNVHTIIYSSGTDIYTITYDWDVKDIGIPILVKSFESAVYDIDVQGNIALVSTRDTSICALEFNDKGQFIRSKTPSLLMNRVTNSLLLDDNVAVTTDKLSCSVTGLQGLQSSQFRTHLSFMPHLKRCQLVPTWWHDNYKERSLNRFIAFGLSGDIQLYTVLDKIQNDEFEKLNKSRDTPSNVTKKGFWDINDGPWNRDVNTKIFDFDDIVRGDVPEALGTLLHSVAI